MKKIVTEPFDSKRIPPKQSLLLLPLFWAYSRIMTFGSRLKISRKNMKGLKPPYIVLGTHHSMFDFYVTQLALFPRRANYVSELEGFEAYGEWLYRQMGCLGTRKFINDFSLIRNIQNVMKRGGILVLYPEARYANVGTSSEIPVSVGKLVKLLGVPLVTLNMQGNYLRSPIWNLKERRQARLNATLEQLLTAEEVKASSVDEINAKITEALSYDEYEYQLENKMKISFPKRAEGLEMALYQCPVCQSEGTMKTCGSFIKCAHCSAEWEMNEYGQLVSSAADGKFTRIPDWYEWERSFVEKLIDDDEYSLDAKVRIESLPNAVNFIDCGEGRLVHKAEGFYLTFKDYGEEQEKTMFFGSDTLISIHTEYDYRGKGQCVTLSTQDNTYFIFPVESPQFFATKIQFATEYFYKKARGETLKSR